MLAQGGLVVAALALGLAGGPHCVAMCAAPASGVIRLVRLSPDGTAAGCAGSAHASALFHLGRLASYSAAGALVAAALQALDLAGQQAGALKPLMAMLHAGVLAWGLALLVTGRQPAWAQGAGHALARRLQLKRAPGRNALMAGALWVLMPCGLLYSALALASLGNGPAEGALAMLAFGLGSGAALVLGRWLWGRVQTLSAFTDGRWGARAGGALLVLLALDALWMDLGRKIALWCA